MELGCRLVVIFALALFLLAVSGILFIRHNINYHFHSTLVLENSFHISEGCLQCIGEAAAECELSMIKSGGGLRISQAYWTDAGMPKLEGALNRLDNSTTAYLRCVNSPLCTARAVNGYIGKHKRDCDGDGTINCVDYAETHVLGHMNCAVQRLPPLAEIRLQKCLKEFSVI